MFIIFCQNILVFDEFFLAFERYPGTIDHLHIIPTGETTSFVKESNIISPSWLYQNCNYGDTRGLVCMHFLAALSIYFGGNSTLSNNVMSTLFHNISTQALSISDHSIKLKFDAIKELNKNINDLINTNIHMQKKRAIISEIQNLDPPTIVGDEPTINNKIESILVKEILNDEKPPTDVDGDEDVVSDIPLVKVAEKIEPDDFGVDLQKLFQANICFDYKIVFNNIIDINKWVNKIKEDHEMREQQILMQKRMQ